MPAPAPARSLDLAARPLTVERLELVAVPDADSASFELVCGKGGYVRSIARDLGERLGCLGHVAALRRLWSGPFTLDGAIGWDALEAEARTPGLAARLLPVRAALGGLPELVCPPSAAARLLNGNPVALPGAALPEGATAWASLGDAPLAVGTWRERRAAPEPGLRAAMSARRGLARARPAARRGGRAADARGAAGARRLRLALRRARRPDRRGRDPAASTPASCWRCAARPIRRTRSAPDGSRSSAATSPRSAASACWCS